jgi:putative permease
MALGLTWSIGLVVPGLFLLHLVTGPVVDDLQAIADVLLPRYERLRAEWPHGGAVERLIAERLPPGDVSAVLGNTSPSEVIRSAVGLGFDAISFLGHFFIVQILSIFWTANRETFERLWLSLVPVDQRPYARGTWLAMKRGVGEKIRADIAESVLASALLYLGFWLLGLHHPVLPALAGGVFRLVPLVGWLLALLTTLVAGLVTDPLLAVFAAAYTGIVLITLGTFVAPRLLRTRRYSPLLLTLVVLVLADAYGVFGILVAPAIAAAIQLFFEKWLSSFKAKPHASELSTAKLAERLVELQRLMAEPELATAPELVNVVERLTVLVAATEEVAGARDEEEPLAA